MATVLNQKSYERYKTFQIRGLRDLVLGIVYDSASDSNLVCIWSHQYTDVPPRMFPGPSSWQDVCAHEIIARQEFCKTLFEPMHMA